MIFLRKHEWKYSKEKGDPVMKELLTTEDLAHVLGINVKKINNLMVRGSRVCFLQCCLDRKGVCAFGQLVLLKHG